jgi:hypothetical protein
MRYLVAAIYSISFLFLFSCDDDGGTISQNSPTVKSFSKITDGVREFIKQNPPREFATNDGINFGDGQGECSERSQAIIDDVPLTLQSFPCQYYFNIEDDFEWFRLVGSAQWTENVSIYFFSSFINTGVPETGTYYSEQYCEDEYSYCYSTVYIYAYLVDNSGEVVEELYTDSPSVQVINKGGRVTAIFDEVFYVFNFNTYEDVPVFNASGRLVCCD